MTKNTIIASLKALRFNIMACDSRHHYRDIDVLNDVIGILEDNDLDW